MLKVNINGALIIIENGLLKITEKDDEGTMAYRVTKLSEIRDFICVESDSKKNPYFFHLNKSYGGGMSGGSVTHILRVCDEKQKEFIINVLEAVISDPTQEFNSQMFPFEESLENKSNVVSLKGD